MGICTDAAVLAGKRGEKPGGSPRSTRGERCIVTPILEYIPVTTIDGLISGRLTLSLKSFSGGNLVTSKDKRIDMCKFTCICFTFN